MTLGHLGLLVGLIVVGCRACTPPPTPPEPTDPEPSREEQCAEACARWRLGDCKNAEDVCTSFDDAGECESVIECESSCVEEPERYDVDASCD